MTREELDFIGSMNMCDEISNEAYKKIVCHCGEQEPCEDAISRQDVLDLAKKGVLISNGNYESVCKAINELSPVNPLSKDYNTIYYTPQPKTGHWININEGKWNTIPSYKCSVCGVNADLRDWSGESPFCPWCGAKMVDPHESEDKE